MNQCYAGGFEFELTHDMTDLSIPDDQKPILTNTLFSSATQYDEEAYLADNWPVETKGVSNDNELPTAPDTPSIEIDWDGSEPQAHWEYNFHMYSATMQYKPHEVDNEYYYKDLTLDGVYYGTVPYSEVDGYYNPNLYSNYANTVDGIITIDEAIQWEDGHESSENENPLCSDHGNIAIHTSLIYPTILSSDLCWSDD